MTLPDVIRGNPHIAAHNDERHAINNTVQRNDKGGFEVHQQHNDDGLPEGGLLFTFDNPDDGYLPYRLIYDPYNEGAFMFQGPDYDADDPSTSWKTFFEFGDGFISTGGNAYFYGDLSVQANFSANTIRTSSNYVVNYYGTGAPADNDGHPIGQPYYDTAVTNGVQFWIKTSTTGTGQYKPLTIPSKAGLGRSKPPLTRLTNAVDGIFRILVTGTSIASFDNSSALLVPVWLQNLYGHPAIDRQLLGVVGGDYEQPFYGWKKQHYGGKQFTRLVGDNTASLLNLGEHYCNKIELEYSRETDSEAVKVYVDGVQVGTTAAAGAQTYRNIISWTGTLATHVVTVDHPTGSGKAYLENLNYFNTAKQTGVDIIDCSLGGTGITNMTNVYGKASGSQQLTPIAISGNNSLDYHFARTDVDLIIVEHIVNDGGNPTLFATNVDYAVEKCRQLGVPIVFIIEPMLSYPTSAGYQAERTKLLSLAAHSWVTVIDWHGILWPGDDLLDNSKATLMNSLYYPSTSEVTHVDTRAYHVLTPILASYFGVESPPVDFVSRLNTRYANTLPKSLRNVGRVGKINGISTTLDAPIGAAVRLEAGGTVDAAYSYHSTGGEAVGSDYAHGAAYTWLYSSTSDQYGKYINGGTVLGGSPTDVGTLYRITFKVGYSGTGGAVQTVVISVPNNMRFEDASGTQLAQTVPGNRSELFYFLTSSNEPPQIITVTARVVSGTSASMGITGGKLYGATVLPNTDVAVLDTITGIYDYLRVPNVDVLNNPVSAVVGGSPRRYESAVGYCYEQSSITDVIPGIVYNGKVRPVYRDPRAAQLSRFDAGGGNFPDDPNTQIQTAGFATTDAFGKYYLANFQEARIPSPATGQEFQVVVKAREIFGFRVNGSNTKIMVNGEEYTSNSKTAWCYTSTDDTQMPPGYFAFRIQAVSSSTYCSIGVRGRIYGLWVTDSTVPLITT